VKKRSNLENNGQSENKNQETHEEEPISLLETEQEKLNEGAVSEIEKGEVADEVEDITNSFIPQLISEEELQKLREELAEARKCADENLDGWQRALAEFANYKKRIERERAEERARIAGEIILRFLNAMDDFERALKDRPENHEMTSWAEGIDLIHRKMKSILDAEGVEIISAQGEIFNPNFHEAISQEESDDHEEGEILEVIQQGYKIGDRVLRPALVRVAK
jgi:molecular chaperone GrpE